ncbi:asparaginase [Variovorax sp. HJSM1_2]|uniref:asparaginase n=1 Tax=Variovorax sp. HJSM1_2 TaxID=3366263 RepID=UPI003BC1F830
MAEKFSADVLSGQRTVVVLGTGGTIAGTAANAGDNVGYTAAQVGVGQLLDAVPGLKQMGVTLLAEQVAQLDSKDMSHAVWQQLAWRVAHWLAQPEVCGVVITHGTDTLEETAYFLQAVLDPEKPVVLTCAMRPSTAVAPDGPQNLFDAVAVAKAPGARGVVAVCAGTVHGALDVQKVHTYRLDAFGSGDAGPLGYVEEGVLRRLRAWPLGNGLPERFKKSLPFKGSALAQAALHHIARTDAFAHLQPDVNQWPEVEIVLSHAGTSGAVVHALLAHGVRGLVVATTGNGSVHHALEAALRAAMAKGVAVVRATRCTNGRIVVGAEDGGQAVQPLPEAGGLSPVKARVALMLALLAPIDD